MPDRTNVAPGKLAANLSDPENNSDGLTLPRSGGRILVDALRVHGVDRMFCVPGESYLEVLDALYGLADIQVIVAKHEGAAANMAEADGKLTGRPGICFVTRGPGATHASVGVHAAFQDSTPMILFIGQVLRRFRGRDAFQEIEFQQMFAPLTKWVAEIESAARIPEYILRAFQCATSGRPGPVVLSLPEDVLSETATVADTARFAAVQAAPAIEALNALRSELAGSQRPLVILGGSGWSDEACSTIQAFAEANALPVVTSFRRQDLIDNDHPCYVGHLSIGLPPHLTSLVRAADLLLAIGTRLSDSTTSGYTLIKQPNVPQRLVHVHADPNELGRIYQADLSINAGPSAFANAMRTAAPVNHRPWQHWTQKARQEYLKFAAVPEKSSIDGVDLAEVVSYLAKRLPPNATVSNGGGNYTAWVHRFYKYRRPRTELASTSGTMGYGFPAAIAAKLRYPERISVCFAGDGCFLMYPQEFATAMQFEAPIIVLVANNGMYGTIRMHQELRFPGRVSGTDLLVPDFVKLAQSFGAYAEKVESTDAFAGAFERALESRKPALLDILIDRHQITPDRRLF